MSLTLEQVVAADPYIRQRMLAVQSILNSLRTDGVPVSGLDPKMEIPFSRAAVIWSYSAIVPRGIISGDGMMVVIQLFSKQLLERAEYWERQLVVKEELTPQILAIADRKLVQLAGETDYYDLQQCQMVDGNPLTFEGVSYNLAIPVQLAWLRVQREAKDGADAKSQRNNPGREHARHGAPGAGRRPIERGTTFMGPGDSKDGARGDGRSQAAARLFEQTYGRRGDSDK
jgi:hypothetical protein